LAFFAHFDFDLATALTEQLVIAFDKLEEGGLSLEHLAQIPQKQGVYQLFRDGMLVYIGKAANLRNRLTQHRRKIVGRKNIDAEEMGFKCLTVASTWTPMALEESLIKHYKTAPGGCEWNGNGFGPHDPGRERETTNKDPEGFDSQFPIRENWPCTSVKAGTHNAGNLLAAMKKELPYLLRYDTKHGDYKKVKVAVPHDGMPAIELLRIVTQNLPGWQATQFPSHLILYKEHRAYTHGTVIWQQPAKT